MSVIFGFYNRAGKRSTSASLQEMQSGLSKFGADRQKSMMLGDVVGLGCYLRWTTPESLHEFLPQEIEHVGITITADARIDNRDELIAQLELGKTHTEIVTDSEVIAAAYERWGEDCPKYLIGDFAFAIWDERKQSLFLARDHFGVKPLVYTLKEDYFAFCTAINPLVRLSCSQGDLEEIGDDEIVAFLSQLNQSTTQTFYSAINRLPAAHSLTITKTEFKLVQYWKLDPFKKIEMDSDDDYAQRLGDIFTEAVRCRMRSNYPVGYALSGGLDSSSIVAAASKIDNAIPLTFSAVVDGNTIAQERRYIDDVVISTNAVPAYIQVDTKNPVDYLPKLLDAVEEPNIPCNLYMNWTLYETAADRGVRVFMEGFDGDNSVGHGVGLLRELAAAGKWTELARELHGYSKNVSCEPFLPALKAWYRNYAIQPWLNRNPWVYKLRGRARTKPEKARASTRSENESYNSRILAEEFSNRADEIREAQKPIAYNTEREKHCSLMTTLNHAGIMEMIAKAGAANGVDVVFPFMDVRLVEFCVALPGNQKLRNGITRFVMRNAMRDILPESVRTRLNKAHYDVNFARALFGYNSNIDAPVHESGSRYRYLNSSVFSSACQTQVSDASASDKALNAWIGLCLIEWMRKVGKCHQVEENGMICAD